MSGVKAAARVQVVLEVSQLGDWNDNCPVSQVREQATASALDRVARLIDGKLGYRIFGRPKVVVVLVEEEEKP